MKSGQITKRPSIEEPPEFLFHHCNIVVFNTLNGDFQISTKIFAYFPIFFPNKQSFLYLFSQKLSI